MNFCECEAQGTCDFPHTGPCPFLGSIPIRDQQGALLITVCRACHNDNECGHSPYDSPCGPDCPAFNARNPQDTCEHPVHDEDDETRSCDAPATHSLFHHGGSDPAFGCSHIRLCAKHYEETMAEPDHGDCITQAEYLSALMRDPRLEDES